MGLEKLLQQYGCIRSIRFAMNGQDAVTQLEENIRIQAAEEKIHLVFMDVNMPVMDGFQATRAIKRMQATNQITWCLKIVMISAFTDKAGYQESRKIGVDYYMSKPVSKQNVLSILQTFK